jgi:DNA-binding transcriptional LysR family regulator
LYTSQPTISEHIHNLESRLNCKLFDRLGRSILPTAEAEVLYPRALSILNDLNRLVDDITATSQAISGELIIGASTIPGAYILPEIAASFRNDNPGISFEIRINDSTRIVDAVASNELLIGVVGAQIANTKVHYQPIGDDELILVAAGDNPVATSLSLGKLCKLPFIIRERGSGTRKNIETFFAKINHPFNKLNICATLGSSAAVKEAVKANLGISAISRYAAKSELERGNLKELKIEGLTMKRSFYLVKSAKRTLPNHYLEFAKRILEATQEET